MAIRRLPIRGYIVPNELDVHAIEEPRASRHVGRDAAVFIGKHPHRGAGPHAIIASTSSSAPWRCASQAGRPGSSRTRRPVRLQAWNPFAQKSRSTSKARTRLTDVPRTRADYLLLASGPVRFATISPIRQRQRSASSRSDALAYQTTQHAADVASRRGIQADWIVRTLDASGRSDSDRRDPVRVSLRIVFDPKVLPPRVVTVDFDRSVKDPL